MKVHAYDRTIRDIFSPTTTVYIVPRFQREYSWEKEEILELWNDILSNIKKDKEKNDYTNNEYFIGSIVLVGDEEKKKAGTVEEFLIVDGQQRLTTITLMISALVEIFKELGEDGVAKGLYAFIEGKDMDNKEMFKLKNETPKPFFQNAIQNYDKRKEKPSSEEEKRLQYAYDILLERIVNLQEKFDRKEDYIKFLKTIRDQILFLKTIFITVDNEDDAYTIFETLNARGINLTTIDLIKNQIFKALRHEHPDDDAKTKWKNIKDTLRSRHTPIKIETFFRHYWLSKYAFARESGLYKSFKSIVK